MVDTKLRGAWHFLVEVGFIMHTYMHFYLIKSQLVEGLLYSNVH